MRVDSRQQETPDLIARGFLVGRARQERLAATRLLPDVGVLYVDIPDICTQPVQEVERAAGRFKRGEEVFFPSACIGPTVDVPGVDGG